MRNSQQNHKTIMEEHSKLQKHFGKQDTNSQFCNGCKKQQLHTSDDSSNQTNNLQQQISELSKHINNLQIIMNQQYEKKSKQSQEELVIQSSEERLIRKKFIKKRSNSIEIMQLSNRPNKRQFRYETVETNQNSSLSSDELTHINKRQILSQTRRNRRESLISSPEYKYQQPSSLQHRRKQSIHKHSQFLKKNKDSDDSQEY